MLLQSPSSLTTTVTKRLKLTSEQSDFYPFISACMMRALKECKFFEVKTSHFSCGPTLCMSRFYAIASTNQGWEILVEGMEDCICIKHAPTFLSSLLPKQLLYLNQPFLYHLHGEGFKNEVEMTKYWKMHIISVRALSHSIYWIWIFKL